MVKLVSVFVFAIIITIFIITITSGIIITVGAATRTLGMVDVPMEVWGIIADYCLSCTLLVFDGTDVHSLVWPTHHFLIRDTIMYHPWK